MRRFTTALVALLATTAMLVVVTPSNAQADPTDPPWATCAQYSVPVTLSPSETTTYNIVGRLCRRTDPLRGNKTVELMVHGFSYDHNYFNSPVQPTTFSYVYASTSWGYSTFNIDRLGAGLSDHPNPALLTVQSEAWTMEQLVRKLRAGTIGGHAFTTVVGIGHSMGTAILQYEAGTVTDPVGVPDFLILQDLLMTTNVPGAVALNASFYPASSDPKFASAGLPAGYYTTMPNTRQSTFYYPSGTTAAVMAMDESSKQTGSSGETSTLAAARTPTITHAIRVPVIVSEGEYDILHCNEAAGLSCATPAALFARESGNFGPRACLKTWVVEEAGHSTNLHIKALEAYNFAHLWLDNYTINGVNQKDANGCLP
jgi:pimeloyl-ACP methyl ester carboxylesterase